MPSTADAVTREAAWLAAYSSADGLPPLTTGNGGPFDIVQPYLPRTPHARRSQLYVVRRDLKVDRFGFNRKITHYQFELRIIWPQSSSTGEAEAVQQNLDNAIDLVLRRVSGLPGDKTHGARFMAVAEDPCEIDVNFADPWVSMEARADLQCTVSYRADDQDFYS